MTERGDLERLAYGRDVDDETRDAAAQRLRQLDQEARRAAALAFEAPEVEPPPVRRRWIVPAAVAAAIAIAIPVTVLALAPRAVAPTPTAFGPADRVPVAQPTNPFQTSYPIPDDAALVQPDVQVQIPEWAQGGGGLRDEMVARVPLGEGQGYIAWGSLLANGQVCLNLTTSSEGFGVCRPYDEFQTSGITADRGGWSVLWMPDGSLTWEGV